MALTFFDQIFGNTWLERVAAIVAFTGIGLAIYRLPISWILDILSSMLYLAVFYHVGLYADSFLQVIFIIMSVYGWIAWTHSKPVLSQSNPAVQVTVQRINSNQFMASCAIVGMGTITGGYLLSHFTQGSAFPYTDSFCTAISIAATWLTAKRIIENWYCWIFVNGVYIYLFIAKHLYPTAVLYGLLLILAIAGVYKWAKILSPRPKTSLI